MEDGLEIVLAPCNAFGGQEPGDADAIHGFARSKGFRGIIMKKGEVNGPDTRPSFKFLKAFGEKLRIDWNFDGKFIVDKRGNVHLPSEDLEDQIINYLSEDADGAVSGSQQDEDEF